GADIAGVASFHGSLATTNPAKPGTVKASLLVLTGADDPHVPPQQVTDFTKEMSQAGADYQIISYSGAVHAFTNPAVGNDPSKGAAYNAAADRRSWAAMKTFFDEILK
ncbi:MAG: dienelactone hydrolase family protein, partial [Myxococcales bacterium]